VLLAGSGNEIARRILDTLQARIAYLRHLTTLKAAAGSAIAHHGAAARHLLGSAETSARFGGAAVPRVR
jgi:hypothetical protein